MGPNGAETDHISPLKLLRQHTWAKIIRWMRQMYTREGTHIDNSNSFSTSNPLSVTLLNGHPIHATAKHSTCLKLLSNPGPRAYYSILHGPFQCTIWTRSSHLCSLCCWHPIFDYQCKRSHAWHLWWVILKTYVSHPLYFHVCLMHAFKIWFSKILFSNNFNPTTSHFSLEF